MTTSRRATDQKTIKEPASFWHHQMAGELPMLNLPTDVPRSSVSSGKRMKQEANLNRFENEAILTYSARNNSSLFQILLAAYFIFLHRYTSQNDMIVGVVSTDILQSPGDRQQPFVNPVALRLKNTGDMTGGDWIAHTGSIIKEVAAYCEYPFERLLQETSNAHIRDNLSIFKAMLLPLHWESGCSANALTNVRDCVADSDLVLFYSSEDNAVKLQWEYNASLFKAETVKRMADNYKVLLNSLLADPTQLVFKLPIVTDAERRQILIEWNHTKKDYPKDRCLHQLFENQAEKAPENVAVVFEGKALTYSELNAKSNQLAKYIGTLGGGLNSVIGIYMDRSLELLIAILGVLKAGAAFVPLATDYPKDRLLFMLEDSNASLLVTQTHLKKTLSSEAIRSICLGEGGIAFEKVSDRNFDSGCSSSNLAYIIYTSGSTGRPKGVMITHRGICNHAQWMQAEFPFSESDAMVQKTPISFDASLVEFFVPLLNGAKLILARPEGHRDSDYLISLIKANSIAILQVVPSQLQMLMDNEEFNRCESLKYVICGAEALPVPLMNKFLNNMTAQLYNFYGPTETSIDATFMRCTKNDSDYGIVPIGRPIANTEVYILDSHLQPVPIGVAGELHIGGTGLASGYKNQLDLTAEKFILHPFDGDPDARLYKTGDLARYLPNGCIEFLGRIDHQIKIRGFRIELEEIEAVLCQNNEIKKALVLLRNDAVGNQRLVAYVELSNGHNPDSEKLLFFLSQKLPEYMLPNAFVFLKAFPLLPNGKIDRSRLPEPELSQRNITTKFEPPQSATERTVAEIWTEVLGIKNIGVNDNFFSLGGHSLLATQVMSRVRKAFKLELSLTDFFVEPTVQQLAEKIDGQDNKKAMPKESNVLRRIGKKTAPLSFPQDQIVFLTQLAPDNKAYTFQTTIHFSGSIDISVLERSLEEIVCRHDVFRTTFHVQDGQPIQRVHPPWKVSLPVDDLSKLPVQERTEGTESIIVDELNRAFHIEQLPLIRWRLIRLDSNEYILIHIEHHLVHDGWSVAVFMRELKTLYRAFIKGDVSPLKEMPIQFSDYTIWQKNRLRGAELDTLLKYWKSKLQAPLPVMALPTDYSRPPVPSYKGEEIDINIPGNLSDKLREISRREGTTLFIVMLSGFYLLLHRYISQKDLIIGTGVANRRFKETEGLIGMLVNTIVLRADISKKMTFRCLLKHVKKLTFEAFEHQDMPFGKLVETLSPHRDLSRNPIFQVLFSFHDSQVPEMDLPGAVGSLRYRHNKSAKFDLNIVTIPWAEQQMGTSLHCPKRHITMKWEYATDLFNRSTIERMINHYQSLLIGVIDSPEKQLSEYSMLNEMEKQQLLNQWSASRSEYESSKSIHQLFEAQASFTPNQVALVFKEHELSYAELNAKANQVAHHLKKNGVGPDTLVGLGMERSIDMLIGMLGILKAGGAYVPLDPSYPDERLSFMMKDTKMKVLLTQEHVLSCLPKFGGDIICIDRDWERVSNESRANLKQQVDADGLAYVMYTSGSTGKPKGVSVIHRGVVRLVKNTNYIDINESDVFLQFAPISFDASTFEIWGALLNGARLVLYPGETAALHELGDIIKKHSVTTLWLTAGLFHEMAGNHLNGLNTVKQLLAGGDVLSAHHVKSVLTRLKKCRLINGYGPTENTTFTCCHVMTHADQVGQTVPIGRPISNTQVYILDDHLQPVPIGVVGELYIGGDGLARGYFNRPDLTAEKFIANPFSDDPSSRLYKSGDLARYRMDGTIDFIGRRDNQVKIRGFRIELGEIESALEAHPKVTSAVVKIWEGKEGDKRLSAYMVGSSKAASDAEIFNFLKQKLPVYMVPSHLIWLESFPLLPSGKVDRASLLAPEIDSLNKKESAAQPKTPDEIKIGAIFSEALGIHQIGIHDIFFTLGGHSLLAARVVSKIRDHFQVNISLRDFFENPTVSGMAICVTKYQLEAVLQTENLNIIDELADISDEAVLTLLEKKSGNGEREK